MTDKKLNHKEAWNYLMDGKIVYYTSMDKVAYFRLAYQSGFEQCRRLEHSWDLINWAVGSFSLATYMTQDYFYLYQEPDDFEELDEWANDETVDRCPSYSEDYKRLAREIIKICDRRYEGKK